METERSFAHAICPDGCRVSEGLLPESSICLKAEKHRQLNLAHTWQLRTMTDKAGLLTDSKIQAQ